MQSDDKYMDKTDDFSREIGEKVKDHTLPVDPSVWEGIEGRLPKQKWALTPWIWAAAGVAAALIGLLFVLNPFGKEQSEPIMTQETEIGKSVTEPETPDKKESVEITKKISQPLIAEKKEKIQQKSEVAHNTRTSSFIADYLKEQQEKSATVPKNQLITAETPKQEVIENELMEEEIPQIVKEAETKEEILLAENTEAKSERSLLAAVSGAMGDAGINFGGSLDNYYAESPLGYDKGDINLSNGAGSEKYTTLKPSDYSDIRHLPPVSFSIMTGFPVSKIWSIETGLMYTYMASRFTKPGTVTYRGKLGLHYIGIPVNAKATFYQNNNWSVYALGGGSIEKGIFSLYRQEIEYSDGAIKHTNVRSAIGGVQLSVHAATGFGYNISDKIQVFGEPRLVYYFNNNQPMSARTENPFVFGLNGGIKITF